MNSTKTQPANRLVKAYNQMMASIRLDVRLDHDSIGARPTEKREQLAVQVVVPDLGFVLAASEEPVASDRKDRFTVERRRAEPDAAATRLQIELAAGKDRQ